MASDPFTVAPIGTENEWFTPLLPPVIWNVCPPVVVVLVLPPVVVVPVVVVPPPSRRSWS